MLRFSSILALLLLPTAALAQSGASISGRVLDDADGRPLPLTAVVIERTESGDTLSGTLTREDGRFFVLGLAPGRYTVHTSFPGFFPEELDLLVSEINPSYDLGEVRLRRLGDLEEVTVTVDAVRAAGIDTQVFQLGDGPAQATGSVLDALRSLPGVTVDQDGQVSLRGSDQVAILIDGRQSSLTGFGSQRGLDNVSAANVAAIEIIYNPSASFDAAGMAGIINVIYEEERSLGLSADVGLSFGVGQFTKQRPDLPTELGSFSRNDKIGPSLALNYNTPRVRTFAQVEYVRQDDLPNNEFTTRFYDDGRVIYSQVPENREQTHYIVRAGSDLLPDDANTLTVSGIYDVENHTDRAQVPFILESTGQRERYWFWTEKEETGFANASLNWRYQFSTPGHELDVNLQYTRGWENESYFLNEESTVRVGTDMTHLEAVENTLPLSIDYTRPLASGRIEVGGKLQTRWLPITYTVNRGTQSVIYDGLGDASDWDEDLFAAYVNLVRARPSYTLEAGVRAEQTNVSYTIPAENIYYPSGDAYDYFELFPNVRFTYTLGGSNRLVAAYNRRIDRPGEPELRIFPKYDDPELLKVGNPYLRPQLTNVFELGLARSWETGSASASAYHRDITDAFQRILAIDSSNPSYDIVNRIYENAGNSKQTGVQLVFDQDLAAPWHVSGSVNWFVNDIDALETTLLFPTPRPFSLAASKDDTWDFTLSNRFRLPGAAELRLGYIYYAARDVPQGRERARSSLDLAATWPFMDERAEVVFTFTDVLNDFAVQTDVQGEGFTALYENFLETQVATVRVRLRL
ncbi:MAG: TonB-dependent receptor [Gemmatimonadota bacterium]|nr:TonB-dependent receptor [Gemmatimonadota bacterium]MDH3422338.1 TonB-dependent receptor [Gemmatimonadota bacterium]